MAKVFLIQNDGSRTPVTVDELKSYAANGRISRDSKIEFAGKIVEVGKIKELQEFFTQEGNATTSRPATSPVNASTAGNDGVYGVSSDVLSGNSIFPGVMETSSSVPPLTPVSAPPYSPNAQAFANPQTTASPSFLNKRTEVSDLVQTDVVKRVARCRLRLFLIGVFIIDVILGLLFALFLVGSIGLACINEEEKTITSAAWLSKCLDGTVLLAALLVVVSFFKKSLVLRTQDAVRQEILLNELLKKNQ